MTLIFVILLLEGLWETKAMSVTGMMDKEITITCSHSNADSNVKYFCKGECTNQDILITSSEKKKDSNKKYSIKDEGNTFYVTISDLKDDDSGTYWCGIQRVGVDTYSKVILTVLVDPDKTGYTNGSFSVKLLYIGVTLSVVVLVLAMALLIFFRHRKSNISTSSGRDHGMVFRSIQKQDAHHDTNTSRSKKDKKTDGGTNSVSTNQHQDTSGPQKQSDNLFYTTVSITNHTESSTVAPHCVTAIYSCPKHKSTEESAIYSNI